jgi:hypothetical protein
MTTRPSDDLPLERDALDGAALAKPAHWVDECWPDDPPSADPLADPRPLAIALDLGGIDDGEGTTWSEPASSASWVSAPEPAVIPWRLVGMVNGSPMTIFADPCSAKSRWSAPLTDAGASLVEVVVAGLQLSLTVERVQGEPALWLGRDALAGRFFVMVEEGA